jgi:hypothetical protein
MKWLCVLTIVALAGLYRLGSAAGPPAGGADWRADLLAGLGNTQPTGDMLHFLESWHRAEGGSAAYNPLNTTQDAPGASCYNAEPCVKNYPDYQTGIDATIATLRSDYPGYAEIVAGLQTNDVERAFNAIVVSPWGTHARLIADVYSEQPAAPQAAPAGRKSNVTPTMEVGAHFDTVDCGAWGFQVGCMHWGTDLLGAEGTPVAAPFDLTIIALGEYGPGPTWGQYVQGTFADGYVFYAGHLEGRQPMSVGDTLPAGALLGSTNSYAHTHIQLAAPGNTGPCAQNGSCVDFEQYFATH